MSAGTRINRRGLLAAGGGLLAGGVLSATPTAASAKQALLAQGGSIPVPQMLALLDAEGTVEDGVLRVDIARSDIGDVVGPAGVTFTPAFQMHGALAFQPLSNGLTLLNGYHPVLATETNAFIDGVRDSGLTVQGFAQHYTELEPQVWFVHVRGYGGAESLASAIRNAFAATATPFPQTLPSDRRGRSTPRFSRGSSADERRTPVAASGASPSRDAIESCSPPSRSPPKPTSQRQSSSVRTARPARPGPHRLSR
jgi:hypothetical protein